MKDKRFLYHLKRKFFQNVWAVRIVLILGVLFCFYLFYLGGRLLATRTPLGKNLGLIYNFVFVPSGQAVSFEGRTNLLILGKGGLGHDAPDLTDTIVFISVSQKGSKLDSISLPRDIWVEDLRAKLNSTYYWGNQKKEGGGLTLAKSEVEQIVGVPVHYGVVVDFSGFREIVDTIGGIDIKVQRSFKDEKYPIFGKENDECGGDSEFGCRYETVEFKEGLQHMDGETALKFVRSRYSQDEIEGTDIGREKRQQLVISAVKDKVLSPGVLLKPLKFFGLLEVVKKNISTDLPPEALAVLARKVLGAKGQISSNSIPEELLEASFKNPKHDNLYVFVPKDGDWSKVQEWVKKILGG